MNKDISSISVLEFSKYKHKELLDTIQLCLQDLIDQIFHKQEQWQTKISRMLTNFVNKGKMIRGSLFLYWMHAYNSDIKDTKYLPIAAAIELLQAFLLIHDDVMDDDDIRRSLRSIHLQFKDLISASYKEENDFVIDSSLDMFIKKGGEALAICLGDILHSYTFNLLVEHAPPSNVVAIISSYSKLVSRVGVGQMNDVYWSFLPQESSNYIAPHTILKMYELKTGDYTFTLPSILAMLSVIDPHSKQMIFDLKQEQNLLQQLGNIMGVIFQIQDDIIGARHISDVSGKPQGSDFIKKKKTYLWSVLLQEAKRSGDIDGIMSIFKKTYIIQSDVTLLLEYADSLHIWELLQELQVIKVQEANAIIDQLHIAESYKEHFKHFVSYLMTRES